MHKHTDMLWEKMLLRYRALSAPVKASFWFALCSFVQKGISFITVPFFTRLMSAEQYGLYSLYLSWDSIIIIFATLNLSYQVFNNGLLKYSDDEDGYTTSMMGLSGVCTSILFVLYLIFHEKINALSGLNTPLFLLMFVQYYFSQAVSLWIVKEKYHYRYKGAVAVTLTLAVASSAFGIVAVMLSEDKVFARVASIALMYLLIGAIIIINMLSKSRTLLSRKYWKYVLLLNLPLIPHYLSLTALGSVDRILINSICGATAVAYYSVAFNVASVLKVLLSSINNSFIPWFYQSMRSKNDDDISMVSTELLIGVAGVSLLPALFGPEIISILGSPDYMEGVWIMPAVSAGVYFTFVYSLFSNFELYYDESRIMMVASIGAALFDMAINFALLPVFGFIAAGYVSLACYILLSIFHFAGMKLVSREKGRGAIPFNMKSIVTVSAGVLALSIVVLCLYCSSIARYLAIVLLFVGIILKRKKLVSVIRKMK